MRSIALKLAVAAIIATGLASSLSGCIMYVSPDSDHHWHHTRTSAPAPDEKPADTVDKKTT